MPIIRMPATATGINFLTLTAREGLAFFFFLCKAKMFKKV